MAEAANNGFKCIKCIQMYISQKGKQIQKNGKKWQKWPKIANNCKISEITKYGEKMRNKQTKQRSPLCADLGNEINAQISLKKINMSKND